MKRKLLTLLISMVMIITSVNGVVLADNDSISVYLDGEQIQFDVPPQIINDRVMVPLRTIFETLNASVDWDDETKTVTASKEGISITLTIDSPLMYVNNSAVVLDSPACIVDGRTLVPVRAISQGFNAVVNWDEDSKTVYIFVPVNLANTTLSAKRSVVF